MTLLSQAETIRDETSQRANTATRVGGLLVDIANELSSYTAAISSAGFSKAALKTTTLTTVGTLYPVQTNATTPLITQTGTGITVSSKITDGDDYSYFSGLNALHAYKVEYNFALFGVDGDAVSFIPCDFAGTPIAADLQRDIVMMGAVQSVPVAYSCIFTGVTSVVLCATSGSVSATSIDTINVIASIIDLGLAV